jgi:hypothetical protein
MNFDKRKFVNWAIEYSDYEALSEKATDAFTGWSTKDPNAIFEKARVVLDVLEEVVNLVEKFNKDVDSLSSKDKLELAVDFLDDIIKFPFYIEWADGMVIKYLVTSVVEQKNKYFGKGWNLEDEPNK